MTLCLALEDVEALYLGPSFLTADPMGPLLDDEDEEALSPSCSLEGKAPASPPLSFSFSSSSSPPPPSHASLFLGTKASEDPLPWLLHAPTGAEHCNDDAFAGMDWMSEKIDLSDLDLESLIGSDDSPEELLASLDPHMDLDLDAFHSSLPLPPLPLDLPPLPLDLPPLPLGLPPLPLGLPPLPLGLPPLPLDLPLEEDKEVVLKSEPPSPAFTLELGSEVDVLDVLSSPVVLPSPPPSGHMLVVNALPDQPIKTSPPSSDCESDSGIESFTDSPPRLLSSPPTPTLPSSSRTKPYSKKPEPSSSSSSSISIKMKSVSGAPKVVEKKLKKMEQNKTAATRYRQKKRVEQDLVSEECEELMKKNEALEERAEAISREINYLKELMEEVRRRRNKSKAP
ncbi:cyclic AMP-dependent transcription factor ATF-4 isoform X2 [Trematomus bernacchii]|uniref:cyclic AMP-dependent transcription factor ATF-4 isoform X2 n=1 Tax=Trematomus bernacchii TaxID=40690 RepID=UPI00146CB20D|nr:cyclic AMP-dependent transcription factor ATF-4 isoform X2 [Trematomus bernacchii]